MPQATDTGQPSGAYINDAYGSLTQTFGTVIIRVVPPRVGLRARAAGFIYTAGTTAHTLTFLVALDEVVIASEAAAAQAVIALDRIPTAADGSILAANDFVVLQREDGIWEAYKVSSLSGLNVTLTANLNKKVLKSSRCFFMGAPGDHTDRQFTIAASTTVNLYGGDARMCAATANKNNQPILAHSDNATVAGTLVWLSYIYVDP